MEVKFNLRDGQTITAKFEDDLYNNGDLEDILSRALREAEYVCRHPQSEGWDLFGSDDRCRVD